MSNHVPDLAGRQAHKTIFASRRGSSQPWNRGRDTRNAARVLSHGGHQAGQQAPDGSSISHDLREFRHQLAAKGLKPATIDQRRLADRGTRSTRDDTRCDAQIGITRRRSSQNSVCSDLDAGSDRSHLGGPEAMERWVFFHYSVFSPRMSGQARIQKDPCRIRTGVGKASGPSQSADYRAHPIESVNHPIRCAMLHPRGR
jgi:hypothetical protein